MGHKIKVGSRVKILPLNEMFVPPNYIGLEGLYGEVISVEIGTRWPYKVKIDGMINQTGFVFAEHELTLLFSCPHNRRRDV